MKRNKILLFLGLLCHLSVSAKDSVKVLQPAEFFGILRTYHPVVRQAELKMRIAQTSVQKARGAFDPKLAGNYDAKQYNGITYFNLLSTSMKVPTWYGVEISAGYEQNSGIYLDPQNTTGGSLMYAGLSVNLGKGLFADERRTVLKQSFVLRDMGIEEQRYVLNDLFLEAGKAYWDWFSAYNAFQVISEAEQLALLRFEAVKQLAEGGDRPYIDTVETFIQWQERRNTRFQAEQDLVYKRNLLSVFLWLEDNRPYELSADIAAPFLLNVNADTISGIHPERLDTMLQEHPALRLGSYRIRQLELDRKLKAEQLKPELSLRYNPLWDGSRPLNPGDPAANYKMGIQFQMPLFLRKERADLTLNGYKLEQAGLDLQNDTRYYQARSLSALNECVITFKQFELYRQAVNQYEVLYRSELVLFERGESSVFLINARENSLIQARLKWIEILTKNRKAIIGTAHALGQLHAWGL